MWKVTFKGLFAKKFRLALTSLAVVLGVAFMAGTFVLTDTLGNVFDDLFANTTKGVDAVVRAREPFSAAGNNGGNNSTRPPVPESLVSTVQSVNGVDRAQGGVTGFALVAGKDGEFIQNQAPTLGTTWYPRNTSVNQSLALIRGRQPRTSTEVALDEQTFADGKFKLGDQAKISFATVEPREFTITAVFQFGGKKNGLAGATLAAFTPSTAQQVMNRVGQWDQIDVRGDPGLSETQVRDRIRKTLHAEGLPYQAITGEQLAKEQANDVKGNLSFFNTLLLIFAIISLFVGAFIIYNTFSITVAQRLRELGLLRSLGATGHQVVASVAFEALAVGLFSSVIGLALGLAIVKPLEALLSAFGIDLPTGPLQVLPRTIIVSLLVGTLVTFVSAMAPARHTAADPSHRRAARPRDRRELRASPLHLGPGGHPRRNRRALSRALRQCVRQHPGAAHRRCRVPGVHRCRDAQPPLRPAGRQGPHLAGREDAQHHRRARATERDAQPAPHRVHCRGAHDRSRARLLHRDLRRVEQGLVRRLDRRPDPRRLHPLAGEFPAVQSRSGEGRETTASGSTVVEYRFGSVSIKDTSHNVTGASPDFSKVTEVSLRPGARLEQFADGGMLVYKDTASDEGYKVGDRVRVEFPLGPQTLTVQGIFDDKKALPGNGNYIISLANWDGFSDPLDFYVGVIKPSGVSTAEAERVVKRVAAQFGGIKAQNKAEFRDSQLAQFDQILGLLYALLLLAVLIALVGIVNTLALSIYERTREIGLLRAVGMTRVQLRRMIRGEALIVASFGAILGLIIGIVFGRAIVEALSDQGISFSLPVGQLIVFLILSGLAGLLAGVLPARRASHLNVLDAITSQ